MTIMHISFANTDKKDIKKSAKKFYCMMQQACNKFLLTKCLERIFYQATSAEKIPVQDATDLQPILETTLENSCRLWGKQGFPVA